MRATILIYLACWMIWPVATFVAACALLVALVIMLCLSLIKWQERA